MIRLTGIEFGTSSNNTFSKLNISRRIGAFVWISRLIHVTIEATLYETVDTQLGNFSYGKL